jgi:cytochrome c
MKIATLSRLALAGTALMALAGVSHASVDAAAAQALAQKNNCTKCHAVDKKKDGPSFKETAAKYKGKADAEAKLFTHLTTGPKVKTADGTEEEHKKIKASEAETKNLVSWILSQ